VLGAGIGVGSKAGAAIGARRPTRMVCIGNMLGFYQPEFFPKKEFAPPVVVFVPASLPKKELL